MKKNLALLAMAFVALSLSACDQGEKTQSESTEVSVGADGTAVETTTSTDVRVEENGTETGTVETETTVDPQGLGNKETVEETKTEVQ